MLPRNPDVDTLVLCRRGLMRYRVLEMVVSYVEADVHRAF